LTGIRDLARHLDISIGTVSRALNDKADVNPLTRARVHEAAAQLGYSPNQSGRSLRRGRTDLVGFVVPTRSDSALIGAVFLSVLDGLRRKLSESGLDLAIFLHGPEEELFGSLRRLTERGLVDGVIISDTQHVDPRIDYLLEQRRPFVAFGRSLSGGGHSWVDPDFEAAVERAVEHLAGFGHRRIGLVLPRAETHFLHIILETYAAALRRRGFEADGRLVQRRPGGEFGGYDAGEALLALDPQPTAILVSETRQTIGLYRKLEESGRLPGRDVSIVGLMPDASLKSLVPALTAFETDWAAVGALLGEALIATLPRAGAAPRPMQAIVPTTFQAGESVHRIASSDISRREIKP
jgi:DNA-binding LacI/PurR family transcriptional regulator